MALSDIQFQEEDGMNFIVEVPAGTLEAPADILIASGESYLVFEISAPATGSAIFIMSE